MNLCVSVSEDHEDGVGDGENTLLLSDTIVNRSHRMCQGLVVKDRNLCLL